MLSLPETKLDEFFTLLKETRDVYLPVDNSVGKAEYKKWEEGVKLSNALNTVRSAKDFFFPQTENIADFKMDGKNIEIFDTREECKDFVIFGAKACDVASFTVLDNVFLAEPVDTYYKNRREHSLVISLACSKPAATCFCSLFDIDATAPLGDIRSYKVEDKFYFEGVSEKGKALLEEMKDLFTDEDSAIVEKQKEETKKVLENLPFSKLNMSNFKEENLVELFNREEWKDLSEACLGCGTCTFVCPTCQCFDIKDFDTGHGIKRFRCWDSCMYSDFTKMAAENPRHTQVERFRQRFMHKLVYYPAQNKGTFGCVGCGRCLASCPVSMNIVKVVKKLGERE